MNAPELNHKVRVSIGLIISLVVMSFTLGGIAVKLFDVEDMALKEIEGLRADWEREMKMQHELNKELQLHLRQCK